MLQPVRNLEKQYGLEAATRHSLRAHECMRTNQ